MLLATTLPHWFERHEKMKIFTEISCYPYLSCESRLIYCNFEELFCEGPFVNIEDQKNWQNLPYH